MANEKQKLKPWMDPKEYADSLLEGEPYDPFQGRVTRGRRSGPWQSPEELTTGAPENDPLSVALNLGHAAVGTPLGLINAWLAATTAAGHVIWGEKLVPAERRNKYISNAAKAFGIPIEELEETTPPSWEHTAANMAALEKMRKERNPRYRSFAKAFGLEPEDYEVKEPTTLEVFGREQFERPQEVIEGERGLTKREKKYWYTDYKQKYRTAYLEADARRIYEQTGERIELPRIRYRGLWWLLDQLDRPRNVAHGLWLAGRQGKKIDPEKILNLLTAEERVYFEDILEDLSPREQQVLDIPMEAMAWAYHSIASKVATNPKDRFRHKVQARSDHPFYNRDKVRPYLGTLGDIATDPLLIADALTRITTAGTRFAMGLRGFKVGKNIKPPPGMAERTIRKGGEMVDDLIRQSDSVDEFTRSALTRSPTGVSEFDAMRLKNTGYEKVIRNQIEGKMLYFANASDKLTDIPLMRLAEDGLEKVKPFAEHAAKVREAALAGEAGATDELRKLTREMVASKRLLPTYSDRGTKIYTRFKNPKAMAELIKAPAAKREAVYKALQMREEAMLNADELAKLHGIPMPTLGDYLHGERARVSAEMKKQFDSVWGLRQIKMSAKAKALRKQYFQNRQLWEKTIGRKQFLKLTDALGDVGRIDKPLDEVYTASRQAVLNIDPRFFSGFKKIPSKWPSNKSIIQGLYDDTINAFMSDMRGEKMQSLFNEYREIEELIPLLPKYVLHNATPAYLKNLKRTMGKHDVRDMVAELWKPTSMSFFEREWAVKGLPLSMEEAQARHIAGKVKRLGSAQKKAPRAVKDLTDIKRPVLIKSRWDGMKKALSFDPTEQAEGYKALKEFATLGSKKDYPTFEKLFGEYPRTVMAVESKRFAKVISAHEYIMDGLSTFGREYRHLSDAERAQYKIVKNIEGANKYLVNVPEELKTRWMQEETFNRMVKAYETDFLGPGATDIAFLKAYDSFRHFSLSYMLGVFPAFHTRNIFGNLNFLRNSGWTRSANPKVVAEDITDMMKSLISQFFILRGDQPRLNQMKQFVPSTGGDVRMPALINFQLQHGVIDGGMYGDFIGGGAISSIARPWKGLRTWVIPGSSNVFPRFGREVGRFADNWLRQTMFLNQLRRGKTLDEAAAMVRGRMGDMRPEVGGVIEREVLNRVFWFHRWNRHNIPEQLWQIATNPATRRERLAAYRVARNHLLPRAGLPKDWLADPDAETPPWILETGAVPYGLDKKTGERKFFIPQGWDPMFDLNQPLAAFLTKDRVFTSRRIHKFILNMMAPPFVQGLEVGAGTSIFSGTQLEGRYGQFLGHVMNAELIDYLRTQRLLVTLDYWDPLGKWRLGRKQYSSTEKFLRLGLGLSTVSVHPWSMKSQHRREYNDELQNLKSWHQRGLDATTEKEAEEAARQIEMRIPLVDEDVSDSLGLNEEEILRNLKKERAADRFRDAMKNKIKFDKKKAAERFKKAMENKNQ